MPFFYARKQAVTWNVMRQLAAAAVNKLQTMTDSAFSEIKYNKFRKLKKEQKETWFADLW